MRSVGRYICVVVLLTVSVMAVGQTVDEQKLIDAFRALASSQVDSVASKMLVDAAIRGMVGASDPHTAYLDSVQARRARSQLNGRYTGYGLEMTVIDDTLTVLRTICDGPADKAGIRPGDRVIRIAELPTTGHLLDMEEVQELLRNSRNYKISFTVVRPELSTPKVLKIKSGTVELSTITDVFTVIDVAVVRISIFGEETAAEFGQIMRKMRHAGVRDIIIDLRGNSGGYVKSAIEIASHFVEPYKTILITRSREGGDTQYYTQPASRRFTGRVVLLVDGNTASSSELLAAAVQDYDRGIVVGRPTYGKGLTQHTTKFDDGSELLVSTSRCISPSGRCIQRSYAGDHSAYRDSAAYRYANPDSVRISPASPKYLTLNSQRVVYGNSGITPDIRVSYGADGSFLLYSRLQAAHVFERIAARTYAVTHGDPSTLSVDDIAERIRHEAKKYGIICMCDEVKASPLIINKMRAHILRQNDCTISSLQYTIDLDPDLQAALRCLQDGSYERLLR